MNHGNSTAQAVPQDPRAEESELDALMAITEREDKFYEDLQDEYGIVVEQCRTCWKIAKHITQKCSHDKPICPRCGSDETHAREACFVMCFRCGEVGAQASHESCPRRRQDILRQAIMKRFDLDAKKARNVVRGKLRIADIAKGST